MFVSASKNFETIKIRTELEFYCYGSENPKCQSREVSIIKRENSLRKFPALQNHAERVVLDLRRNIWYTSPGEQRSHLLKELKAILNADEQNGCWKVKCFSISYQKMRFLKLKIFNKTTHSLALTSQKLYWKQQSVRITIHETKENFRKCRAFANSLTYCDFSSPNYTKLSDSLVQAQRQYGSN